MHYIYIAFRSSMLWIRELDENVWVLGNTVHWFHLTARNMKHLLTKINWSGWLHSWKTNSYQRDDRFRLLLFNVEETVHAAFLQLWGCRHSALQIRLSFGSHLYIFNALARGFLLCMYGLFWAMRLGLNRRPCVELLACMNAVVLVHDKDSAH